MKQTFIILLIVVSSLYFSVNNVHAAVGVSIPEAVSANLGFNNATIATSSIFYFNLTATADQYFYFTLYFDASIDLDFGVRDSDGTIKAISATSSTPEKTNWGKYDGILILQISSTFAGGGDFGLLIEEGYPPQNVFDKSTYFIAEVGQNDGALNPDYDFMYFNFTGDPTKVYNFTLVGPENSNYRFSIYNLNLGLLASNSTVSSQKTIEFGNYNTTMALSVSSFSYEEYYGPFQLFITPIPELTSVSYSSIFKQGNKFQWQVTVYTSDGNPYPYDNSTIATIEVLASNLTISADEFRNNNPLFSLSFSNTSGLHFNQADDVLNDLDIFMLPFQAHYDDNKDRTFEYLVESLTEFFGHEGKVIIQEDGRILWFFDNQDESTGVGEYIQVVFDPDTGRMVKLDFNLLEPDSSSTLGLVYLTRPDPITITKTNSQGSVTTITNTSTTAILIGRTSEGSPAALTVVPILSSFTVILVRKKIKAKKN